MVEKLEHRAKVIQIEVASYRVRAYADLMRVHARTLAAINPLPPPRRDRPFKNGAARH